MTKIEFSKFCSQINDQLPANVKEDMFAYLVENSWGLFDDMIESCFNKEINQEWIPNFTVLFSSKLVLPRHH